jgi:hypothetical protein
MSLLIFNINTLKSSKNPKKHQFNIFILIFLKKISKNNPDSHEVKLIRRWLIHSSSGNNNNNNNKINCNK